MLIYGDDDRLDMVVQPSRQAKSRTSAKALIQGGLSVALASYQFSGSDMPAPATENPTLYRP